MRRSEAEDEVAERREYEDGAFYWLSRRGESPTVIRYDAIVGGFDLFQGEETLYPEQIESDGLTIGPCIGKEPAGAASLGRTVEEQPDYATLPPGAVRIVRLAVPPGWRSDWKTAALVRAVYVGKGRGGPAWAADGAGLIGAESIAAVLRAESID